MHRRLDSISSKLGFAIGFAAAATTLLCAVAVGVLLVWMAATHAVETARANATGIAGELAERLNRGAQITQELQGVVGSAVSYGDRSRGRMLARTLEILQREPDVHGVWLISEPNGFDGRDAYFRGAFGSSAQGEFYPYWYRADDGRLVQDTTGRRTDVAADRAAAFYRLPVTQDGIVVTEPFVWRMGEGAGAWKTMSSVSGPVRVGGRLVGVVGVDLYIDDIVQELSGRTGDRLKYALLSDTGVVVISNDPKLIRRQASSLPVSSALLARAAATGRAGVIGAWAGEPVALVSLPLSFETSQHPWRLVVAQPTGATFATASKLGALAVLAGGLLTALAAWLGRRFGVALARPVSEMAHAMRRMSNGDMSTPAPPPDGSSELREMGEALEAFRDFAARAVNAETARLEAERIARGRAAQLRIASANLPLQAFLEMIVEELLALTSAEVAAVALVEGDHLVCRAAAGQPRAELGIRIPIEASLSGEVVRSRTTLVCDDVDAHPRAYTGPARKLGLRSLVFAPLADGEHAFGVLTIGAMAPGVLTPQHGADLTVFAEVVASAIARELAREAAEHANRAKTEFLANMSHEIRTPLNGILGTAEVLARSELSPRDRELIAIIRSSGDTLASLLSDILDQARIEAGQLRIEVAPFHLGELVRAVESLWRLHADERGVRLTADIAPGLDRAFQGDALRIRQILTNFVSNAVKFTTAGAITIEASSTPAGWLRLAVRDTGVGFDAEQQSKIFGRFEQADGSITRRFGGTGLGLAISRQLTELMSGEIDCASVRGEGSTFWVDLPLEVAELAEGPLEAEPTALAEEELRILIADDHPTNRKVVELMLDQLGASYVSVEDGAAAVDALAAERFDVVLMDMQMPVMDGLSATRAIREREAQQGLHRTPIVMLTANAQREHVEAGAAAGADSHLAKPITAASLFQAIAGALDDGASAPCEDRAAS